MVLISNGAVWLVILFITTIFVSNLAPFANAFIFSFFNVGMLAFAYYLNIFFVNRFIEKQAYGAYMGSVIVLIVAVAYIRFSVNSFILARYLESFPVSIGWKYLFSGVSTLVVAAISLFYGLLINRSRKEREYQMMIFKQQQLQLNFLKAQMSPHFLFNSLNNIYSLCIGTSPKATEIVLLLSEVLRYVIYESKKDRVTLAKDIEQIHKLIRLHQLKSETDLDIVFKHSLSNSGVAIEPMILIPLVENCFKHGNVHHSPNGFISIILAEKNGVIEVALKNSKDKQQREPKEHGGVGLENIKQRLALMYPTRHQLKLTDADDYFSVMLEIDVRNGQNQNTAGR